MENDKIGLLCRLPSAAGLQKLSDLAYEILGNPVFISDLSHTILAYTQCVEISDPIWQENVVQHHHGRDMLLQKRDVGIIHERSEGDQRAVLVEDDFQPYPRIIKSLVQNGLPVGVMVVTAYFAPFAPGDIELVELIASFIAPKLIRDAYFDADSKRTVENFFIKLLDGAKLSREQIRGQLDALEYHEKPHSYVLCIGAADGQEKTPRRQLEELIEVFDGTGACRTFLYNAALVCVYGSDEDISDWTAQASSIAALLWEEGLQAGVSRGMHGFEQFRDCYRQASDALEIGLWLGRPEVFLQYDSLSSFALFQKLPEEVLKDFCHEKIRLLSDYDDAHSTELRMTLQVYLEQAKSLAKTADILFIHRNTVRYRIRKCMELMNNNLEDGNEIFAFILSLRIMEYLRKFPRGAVIKEEHHDGEKM